MINNQIKKINLSSNDSYSLHQKRFLEYLDDRNILMNNNIEIESIEAVKISVLNNLGIAYLPDYTVKK